MESSQSNKRPHSGDENDDGGKRGKFSGRGRGGGGSFRGFAGGGGDGQSGQGFRGGRGFGGDSGFKGGRGGFRGGEGGRFRGGRGGNSSGFRGGQRGFRARGGGGFRGDRGGEGGGFRGGRGGFRSGESGGFRGGRDGFRGGEGSGFRREQGGFRGRGRGFRGGRGGWKREGGNSAVMNQGSGFDLQQKVYAEFPDWNTDLIHKVLAAIYQCGQHNINWHQVSEKIKNSLAPDEIEKLWNNVIAKLEPPTFQCVLDSIKMLLKRTVKRKKLPELPGLPRTFESLRSYINKVYGKEGRKFPEELNSNTSSQKGNIFWRLTPTEKLPFSVAWKTKQNEYDLLRFNYLKEHPEEFQEWSDLTKLNNPVYMRCN